MSRALVLEWLGFGVSLICTLFGGLALGYNVYAVQLKSIFDLTQTQVELLGSFTVTGWSLTGVGSLVYQRFGHKSCCVMAMLLMTSSSLMMWLATHYVAFFRQWSGLMCVFLLMFTAGAGAGSMCCTSVAIGNFSKENSGKIIGLYLAIFGLGKIYYSALYEIFFQTHKSFGNFFVTVAISITVSFTLCCFLHKSNESRNAEVIGETKTILDQSDSKAISYSWNKLLTSGFFWMMVSVTVLFHASILTFMNNVTGIGEAVGLDQSLSVVYLMAAVLVVCRLMFGAIYDHFQSQTVGTVLLHFCQISFCSAMLIGLLALNDKTVYVMATLGAIACGAGFSLPLAMMTSHFGKDSYPGILAVVNLGLGLANIGLHIVSGVTYDRQAQQIATSDLFCDECFAGTFVILLSSAIASAVLLIIKVLICDKR